MIRSIFYSTALLLCIATIMPHPAQACEIEDRPCLLKSMTETAAQIQQTSWRDQTYREIAKTYAFDGDVDTALGLIDKIETPDTKAMTIRGIGMAVADHHPSPESYTLTFKKLRTKAETITHPPSYAIALTYIAMAQAFADDDAGAWKTAQDMENDALRHKAYGETAEIQAEKGKFDEAMKSIAFIDSLAFRNKAYTIVSRILAEKNFLPQALKAAQKITNPYKKTSAIQFVMDTQKPREVEKE